MDIVWDEDDYLSRMQGAFQTSIGMGFGLTRVVLHAWYSTIWYVVLPTRWLQKRNVIIVVLILKFSKYFV
jgi:hypothetical protein